MSQGNQYVRFGTSNMVLPPEGPRAMPFDLDFQSAGTITEDLTLPIQNGVIQHLQSMFVDNNANNAALSIKVGEKGQTIIVPPRAQGYFSILFNDQDGRFEFKTTPAANLIIRAIFTNVPIMPAVWKVT